MKGAIGAAGVCTPTTGSADNDLLTIVLDAAVGVQHVVRKCLFSYDATPSTPDSSLLSIQWVRAGVTKTLEYSMENAALNPVNLDFDEGLIVGDENTEIGFSVTASGDAGNVCRGTVFSR